MKKIIGLVVIVAVLILGGYYATGFLAERALKKNISLLNNSNGITVDIKQYQRGWFTSNALFDLKFHTPEHEVKEENGQVTTISAHDYTLQVPMVVSHGPIIFNDAAWKFGYGYAHSEIALPKEYAEMLANTYTSDSVLPKLTISVFVNYFNKIHLGLDLPAFKLITKQDSDTLDCTGVTASIRTSPSMETVDGHVVIDGARYQKKDLTAKLGKVTSEYAMQRSQWGLYTGKADFSIPSFVILEGENQLYEMNDFDFKSNSDITNGLFSSDLKASLGKFVAHGKTFGPAAVTVAIKNLDAQSLAKINDDLNKMQQDQAIQRQQALLIVLPELPKLFGQGAQFALEKLSFVLPEGEIDGNLSLSLPKGNIGNPFQLLQKVQGHGEIKMPVSLVKGITKALIRQRILNGPSVQQAMVQQMKNNAVSQGAEQQTHEGKDNQGKNDQPQEVAQTQQSKPLSAAEVDEQASTQTDQKLVDLVKVGLLSQQGNNYIIVVNLANGQLTINGQPFSPAMIQL